MTAVHSRGCAWADMCAGTHPQVNRTGTVVKIWSVHDI